jgi:hypothetical protein
LQDAREAIGAIAVASAQTNADLVHTLLDTSVHLEVY